MGGIGHNRFTCNNGVKRSCAVNQECYAKVSFPYGYWYKGCRKPPAILCQCDTPRKGTKGYNRFSCSNGISRYCAATQECYSKVRFLYGSWNKGCRKPPGSCRTRAGIPCVFPFTYKGKKYHKCTNKNYGKKLWCSTTAVYQGKWGPCNNGCKAVASLCECDTPMKCGKGNNRISCNNGVKRYCGAKQECYAKGTFPYGYWYKACRKRKFDWCKCATPRKGTKGHNQFYCSNGVKRFCNANQECYAFGRFNYGSWNKACRIPPNVVGSCKTKTGVPCVFPFIYKGNKYYQCTNKNHGKQLWCSTTAVYKGKWGPCIKGCKPVVSLCKCDTPRKGAKVSNRFTCTNGVKRYCASKQECYAKGNFPYGYWNQGCRRPPVSLCKRRQAKQRKGCGRRRGCFIVKCNKNGSFKSMQCHGSTGYCWCVDAKGKKKSRSVRGGRNLRC